MNHILYNSGVESKNVVCFGEFHSVYEINYRFANFKHFEKNASYFKSYRTVNYKYLTFAMVILKLKKFYFKFLIIDSKFDQLQPPFLSSSCVYFHKAISSFVRSN